MRGQTIYHAIQEHLKHIAVVGCISAARKHRMRFFASSQVNDTVERRRKIAAFRRGLEVILKQRRMLHMSSQFFSESTSTVVLPYIDKLRPNEEFAGKEAVLLMDNCCIHLRPEPLQMPAGHQVKAITVPPHMNDIFESLDLSLFGNFKKKMNC
jgi:hypothetical protein